MKNKYLHIQAWGDLMKKSKEEINLTIEAAHNTKAPDKAIFQNKDLSWATMDDVKNIDTHGFIYCIIEDIKRFNGPIKQTI